MGRRAQSASGKEGCRCVERGIAQRGCFAACQLPCVKIQLVPCRSWHTKQRCVLNCPFKDFWTDLATLPMHPRVEVRSRSVCLLAEAS